MAKLDNKLESNQKPETEFKDITENGGIKIIFSGKANAQRVMRKVKPRILREIAELSISSEEEKNQNLVIEGDNLKVMTSLYQYHGKIDLIITDPPYNTGKDFRYNDNEDKFPNDLGVGDYVDIDDTAKHTKWMKFMLPRLQMMKQMLKPSGVLAICIDERELFRLGPMLNEIFGEENRIAIINWQKTYALRADQKNVISATEYVLIYSKDLNKSTTGLIERTEKQLSQYKNPDNDPKGLWAQVPFTATTASYNLVYGVQNPFTGEIQYPPPMRPWRRVKARVKPHLEKWGMEYEERDLQDGKVPALVIKGSQAPYQNDERRLNDPVVKETQKKAYEIYKNRVWPEIIFLKEGVGRMYAKQYLKEVMEGLPPTTYWANENHDKPFILGTTSWSSSISGSSRLGSDQLKKRVNFEEGFMGPKPLSLFTKIIHLWCPPNGLVLDPFAGSGTTGEIVLQLNKELRTEREREREREREQICWCYHQTSEQQWTRASIYSNRAGI